MGSKVQNKRKVSRQWNKDEIKTLIIEFESRPDLWDQSRSDYSDRQEKSLQVNYANLSFILRLSKIINNSRVKKQKLLEEIGKVLGVSSQDVSAKIHALRTQFNRECAREKKTKSGSSSDENYISKWEHTKSLKFLKIDSMVVATTSNLVR